MQLTTDTLARFVGGQLEIQNPGEGYIYRGEIESVVVEYEAVKVKFLWLAKGKGFPPLGWVHEDNFDYVVSTMMCSANVIGEDRVAINFPIVGELAVFFPPNGSKLDPSKVEGLKLTA